MRRVLTVLAALAALAATPAAALRCAPSDPLGSLAEAMAAPESYRVLLGRLDFDDALLPPPVADAPPATLADVPARLVGGDLRGGEASLDVVIRPSCAGPWCGWIPSGEDWLLFARQEGDALVVEVGPCGGRAFMDPTPGQVAAVRACLDGGACAAP